MFLLEFMIENTIFQPALGDKKQKDGTVVNAVLLDSEETRLDCLLCPRLSRCDLEPIPQPLCACFTSGNNTAEYFALTKVS